MHIELLYSIDYSFQSKVFPNLTFACYIMILTWLVAIKRIINLLNVTPRKVIWG